MLFSFVLLRLRLHVIAVPLSFSTTSTSLVCVCVFLRAIPCEAEASLIALGTHKCGGIGVPKKEGMTTNLLLLVPFSHASGCARSAPVQRNDNSAQQDLAKSKKNTNQQRAVVFGRCVVTGASIFFLCALAVRVRQYVYALALLLFDSFFFRFFISILIFFCTLKS